MDKIGTVLVGALFGFVLHRTGFADWSQVHAMFAFTDLRLFLGFCLSVMLLAGAWVVIARIQHPNWTPRKFHPGIIPGGILFGAGWALCGGCPSIALAQVGAGHLVALVTVVGIFAGNFLYPFLHARFFRWTTNTCVDD